jgi:hypothetical protein
MAAPFHPDVCWYWVIVVPGSPRTLPRNVYHQWPSIRPMARRFEVSERLRPMERRLPVNWLRKTVMLIALPQVLSPSKLNAWLPSNSSMCGVVMWEALAPVSTQSSEPEM